jgi:predicted nucleotidyltransferase
MVFSKTWGSRSHNTNKESSDWDFSGVYVGDTKRYLGMTPEQESFQNKEGDEKPDFSFHEVGKFCNLLLVGNPGIVEMLFTEIMCISTPEWEELKANRKRFLSKSSVRQYLGYAEGQLKKLKHGNYLHTKGGDYNEKWAYHLIRLLMDAEKIVNGSIPVIWKEEGSDEHKQLMQIRHEKLTKQDVIDDAEKRVERINARLLDSKLPERGDQEFLEDWLVNLRLKQL